MIRVMAVTPSEDCIYKDLTVRQLPRAQPSSQNLKNIQMVIESSLLMLFCSTLQMQSFNCFESRLSHALCDQTPLNLPIVTAF